MFLLLKGLEFLIRPLSAGTNMKIIYANRLTDEVERKEGKKTTTTLIPFKLLSKMMEKFNLLVKLD